MWRQYVRLEIGRKAKNLKLTWYHSQGQQNLFLQAIIHFAIFNVIISVVKGIVGSHLDKISCTEWRHENAASPLSTVQNGGALFKFWASLEINFMRKTFTLEAQMSVQT